MWRVVENRAYLRLPPVAAQIDLTRPDLGLGELSLDQCPHPGAQLLQVRPADPFALGAGLPTPPPGTQLLHVRPEDPFALGAGLPTPPPGTQLLHVRPEDLAHASPARLQDHYLRGADLIACYHHSDGQELTTQVYWRGLGLDAPAVAGLELIVSVQTDRLDSDPRLVIGSQLPVEEVLRLADERTGEFQPVELADETADLQMLHGSAALLHRLPASEYSYVEMIQPGDCGRFTLAADRGAAATARWQFRLFEEHLEKGVIRRGRLRGVFVPRAGDRDTACRCFRQFVESPLPLTA